MAQSEAIGNKFDANGWFDLSFKSLGVNEGVYNDRFGLSGKAIDINKKATENMTKLYPDLFPELKAGVDTTAGGLIGTTPYAMYPVWPDLGIVDETRKLLRLVNIFPRVAFNGLIDQWNLKTADTGAHSAAENASLTVETPTYSRATAAIKYLYAVGRVSGPSNAAMPNWMTLGQAGPQGMATLPVYQNLTSANAIELEKNNRTIELKKLEENMLLNGNATTSGISGNPNGTEFDGIVTLLSGGTNENDLSDTEISVADIDQADEDILTNGGMCDLCVCSPGVFTSIKQKIYRDQYRVPMPVERSEMSYGYNALMWQGQSGVFPIISSQYLDNTSGSRSMYFLTVRDNLEVKVLLDSTYQVMPADGDYQKFMIKQYQTLKIGTEKFDASIINIT